MEPSLRELPAAMMMMGHVVMLRDDDDESRTRVGNTCVGLLVSRRGERVGPYATSRQRGRV